jgi:hypothetical protein
LKGDEKRDAKLNEARQKFLERKRLKWIIRHVPLIRVLSRIIL